MSDSDTSMAYVGRADCGCIRAVVVDVPEARDLTARETARFIRQGLAVERVAVSELRAGRLTRPDCGVHATSGPRQGALL